MIVIGITGLIGSGKSEVCRILKTKYKIPVLYADILAKHLYKFDKKIKKKVIDSFGEKIVTNKEIDFQKLSSTIFNNESNLKKLENIVLPALIKFEKKLLPFFENKFYFFVAIESALLVKSNEYKNCNHIILVQSNNKIRLTRVKKHYRIRDIYQDKSLIEQRYNFEINNNGSLDDLNNEVTKVMQQIIEYHKNEVKNVFHNKKRNKSNNKY